MAESDTKVKTIASQHADINVEIIKAAKELTLNLDTSKKTVAGTIENYERIYQAIVNAYTGKK